MFSRALLVSTVLAAACGGSTSDGSRSTGDQDVGAQDGGAEGDPLTGDSDAGSGGSDSVELAVASEDGLVFEGGLVLAAGESYAPACSTCTVKNGIELGSGLDLLNGVNLGNANDMGNGVTGPHYAPPAGSDLEKWLDADPVMNKRVLSYLVECALPQGVEVQLLYRGDLSALGTGLLGLGPSLASGEMPLDEQEWVSACLIARQNGLGRSLLVELRGPHANLGQSIPTNDSLEAVFYGNLFSDTPTANVVHSAPVTSIRACADGDRACGMVAPFYRNYTTTCGPYQGQTAEYCFGDGGYSTRVITVFFPSRPDGDTCDYFMQCESLRCVDQVCIPRLMPGASCQEDNDCDTGICDGICSSGAVGDRCDGHWNCSTDFCGAGACTEGVAGDACSSTEDCLTGVCKNNGTCQ